MTSGANPTAWLKAHVPALATGTLLFGVLGVILISALGDRPAPSQPLPAKPVAHRIVSRPPAKVVHVKPAPPARPVPPMPSVFAL